MHRPPSSGLNSARSPPPDLSAAHFLPKQALHEALLLGSQLEAQRQGGRSISNKPYVDNHCDAASSSPAFQWKAFSFA